MIKEKKQPVNRASIDFFSGGLNSKTPPFYSLKIFDIDNATAKVYFGTCESCLLLIKL